MCIVGIKWAVRSAAVVLVSIALTGCFEIEEDNAELVAEMKEQNRLLAEQQPATDETATIMLYGTVVDSASSDSVDGVTVQIKVGPNWQEPISFEGGSFELAGLEPSSDYELMIKSPSGAFLDRVVIGSTREAGATEAYQNLGVIAVAPGVVQVIAAMDSETHEPVQGLEFKAYSHVGGGSEAEFYAHRSEFDSETGLYSITVPQMPFGSISVSLDLNGDGFANYLPRNGYSGAVIHHFSVGQLVGEEYYLSLEQIDGTGIETLTLNVSVFGLQGSVVSGAPVSVDDDLNRNVEGIYSESTEQYSLTVRLDDSLSIFIPSFTSEGTHYGSSYLAIYDTDTENYYRVNGYGSGIPSYYVTAVDGSLNLVMELFTIQEDSDLTKVYSTLNASSPTYTGKVYYSSGIELLDDSVKLYRNDVVSVVRGSDSEDDFILGGRTSISAANVEEEVASSVSLGNTLLTVDAVNSLTAGNVYSYQVGNLVDEASDAVVDVASDNLSFYVASVEPFSFADVMLDNNNYWTNGNRITAETTAGVASTRYERSETAYLYFPQSIEGLKSLTLSMRQITSNGTVSDQSYILTVVENGVVQIGRMVYPVTLAYEESLSGSIYPIVRTGTALPEGELRYSAYAGASYRQDNKATSKNTILYEYVYETADSEIVTGLIELPIH